MGLFDRLRNFADKVLGRSPAPADPTIDSGISRAWEKASSPAKPSFFERLRENARGLFGVPKRAPEPAQAETRFEPPSRPKHFKPDNLETRREEIFKFRRNTQAEGNAFYRLTQSIWDDPNVPASKRDEAIVNYFKEKYGMDDLNEIYDFVLERNKEFIEAYRNSPNGKDYELLKNLKIEGLEL